MKSDTAAHEKRFVASKGCCASFAYEGEDKDEGDDEAENDDENEWAICSHAHGTHKLDGSMALMLMKRRCCSTKLLLLMKSDLSLATRAAVGG